MLKRFGETFGLAKGNGRLVALRKIGVRPDDADQLFPVGQLDRELRRVANRHIGRTAARGVVQAWQFWRAGRVSKAGEIGIPANPLIDLPPTPLAGIETTLNQAYDEAYWSVVNTTTRDGLRKTIQAGIVDGLSTTEMARKIAADDSGLFSPERARRIARTETTGALNSGHFAVEQELVRDPETGVTGREWAAIIDRVTRQPPRSQFSHVAVDGQQTKGLSKFDVSGEPANFPGDTSLSAGNRIYCRCTTVVVVDF